MFYLCADTQDLANVRSLLMYAGMVTGNDLASPSIRELNAPSTLHRKNLKTEISL